MAANKARSMHTPVSHAMIMMPCLKDPLLPPRTGFMGGVNPLQTLATGHT